MALETTRNDADSHGRYSMILRSGTRTAADFTVDLGFDPRKVVVTNLTDRVRATWLSIIGDDTQLVEVAAGTMTYADAGVSCSKRQVNVTVATAGLETDDDDVLIEAWG